MRFRAFLPDPASFIVRSRLRFRQDLTSRQEDGLGSRQPLSDTATRLHMVAVYRIVFASAFPAHSIPLHYFQIIFIIVLT